jgi:hypothetical protein
MILWTSIMMGILGVDIDCRNTIMSSNNLWTDIHMNEEYSKYIRNYAALYTMMFCLLKKYEDYPKSKLYYWNDIITNPFTNSSYKEELSNIFCKTQKHYSILNRFFLRCKINIMKPKINMDMEMNEIVLKEHVSMKIYQDGALYYFTLRDLINICKSALLYSVSFFNEPYLPKNPYTNNEFPLGVLLNIYLEIRKSNYEMPMMLQLLYKEMFDIDKFLEKNEYMLREEAIKDFVKTASAYDKMNEIMDMLQLKGIKKKFKFDEDFPPKTIIKAFEPLLYFYIVSEYSMRPHNKRLSYRNLVQYKLLQFSNENASFGRKIKKSTRMFDMTNFQTKIKWEDAYSEDFKPINPAQFPTPNTMFRYIMRHRENDSESDVDESDSSDSDDDVEIIMSNNSNSNNNRIVFDSDEEDNNTIESGEINENEEINNIEIEESNETITNIDANENEIIEVSNEDDEDK